MKVLSTLLLFFNAAILLLDPVTGGPSKSIGTRIIGGELANAGQFKFAAAIFVQTSNSRFFCGGALISNLWILTSGHCVNNAVLFTIQLGSNTLEGDDENRVTVATSDYDLHPDFNPDTMQNDIGVIHLRMAVMLNGYIQPIFSTSIDTASYSNTFAIGFGQTTESGLSNELRYTHVAPISNEECRLIYGDQINDNMVCVSGNYNEGACIGDTGGPLVANSGKYYLIMGVSSFISGNGCESTDPSGYTKLIDYREWLRNVTGINV